MTVSDKQLIANRNNANKGGVKTEDGKAIVKYNALKHGLLAREAVITAGDGAENPEEFAALLADLKEQFNPVGTVEEMLVEKVATSYWRLRRACKYEVGLIRNELDNMVDKYYHETTWDNVRKHKTEDEVLQQIEEEHDGIEEWKQDKKTLTKMHKDDKPLDDIYDWETNWEWLQDKVIDLLDQDEESDEITTPSELRSHLNKAGWSDDQIWEAHIEICDERIKYHTQQIAELEKTQKQNVLKLQVLSKLGSIPSKHELDRLLRYEGAIERQFYKALNQLERLQRLRAGESVPAPVEVDVNISTEQ